MLVSLEGEEASGKTTFAYTAPLKVVGFSFDMGAERALFGAKHNALFNGLRINLVPYDSAAQPTKVWGQSDITVYELPPPVQLDSIRIRGRQDLWNYFIILFADALKDSEVRSLVVDTATVARRVRADAYLETLQNEAERNKKPMRERLLQIEWGAANDSVRDLYTTSQGLKKNLITTHHLTNEYKDVIGKDGQVTQAITGRRILEGLAQTYRYVDVAMRMEKGQAEGIPGQSIIARLVKCGYNLDLEGVPTINPTWDSTCNLISSSLGDRISLERRNHEPAGQPANSALEH